MILWWCIRSFAPKHMYESLGLISRPPYPFDDSTLKWHFICTNLWYKWWWWWCPHASIKSSLPCSSSRYEGGQGSSLHARHALAILITKKHRRPMPIKFVEPMVASFNRIGGRVQWLLSDIQLRIDHTNVIYARDGLQFNSIGHEIFKIIALKTFKVIYHI